MFGIGRAGLCAQIGNMFEHAAFVFGGDLVETNPAAIDRMLNLNVNVVMKKKVNLHWLICWDMKKQ